MAMSSQPQLSQSGGLTSDDLQEVFEALYSIAPGKVINFGLKLKVSRNVIQSFELRCADIYDILREILDYRLNQLPPLTWHDIVRILQSPTVQQHDLARTIESQYITASQSPASVSQQASAESSHAAIHTSGAQPSTHAPPQPPLHTVAAASVPLTHTPIALPQPLKPVALLQPPVDGVPAGQRPLTSNDLPHLLNVLTPVASKCYYIGLQLGVKIAQIANIEFNHRKCEDQLREILVERLKQEPPLTWQDIVTALRADSVREYGLYIASAIESKYIPPLHPPTSVTPQVSTDSSMFPATQCVSSHAPLQSSLPASVSQQASAESSHAAIHTSGAQPSTHAPPQPPLHTVAAASVPLTHTLPQPSFYNAGQPLQLTLFTNQPSMLPNPNAFAPHPAYNFHLPLYHQHYIQPQPPPQHFVPPHTLSQPLSASSQVSYGPTSVAASGSNLSHAGVEDSSHTSNSSSHQAAHNPPHIPPPSMQPRAQNMPFSLSPYRHPQYIQQQRPPQHPPINIPYPTPCSSQTAASTSRHVFQEQLGSQPNTQLYTSHPEHQSVHEHSLRQSGSSSSELGPPQAKKARNEPILERLKSNTEAHSLHSLSQEQSGSSLGSSSKKTTFKSPMDKFVFYVKATYKQNEVEKDLNVIKWPPTPSEVFINLACIDWTTVVTKEEADECTRAMVEDGNVDVILRKKKNIDFDDIVRDLPATDFKKVILVEGAPGVGKSTFAWEFCRRWERGEIAQQYQLVLLLRLRDERMGRAQSLGDLIYHPSKTVASAVEEELISSLGVSTLIILEGFDELSDTLRRPPSVYLQLILGQLLPFATVLITSRPWATSTLLIKCQHRVFQHIEILGFTEQNINDYVTSVFGGKERKDFIEQSRTEEMSKNSKQNIDGLMTYLGTYPQIKACMYIPLNAAIVVSIYQESKMNKCILPRTLTELYYALTQILLLRYLYGHVEYGQRKWNVHSFKKDLPSEIYAQLLLISKLAYEGICTDWGNSVQLIYPNLPTDFETLGLMQSVSQLYVKHGQNTSHNFLHLTVQEFLAALHISTIPSEKQLDHFKRHYEGRFRVVLRFLAGLTKLTALTHDQFKGLLREIPDQQGDEQQRDCCKRMVPDISVSVHHINWLFEAQNTVLLHNHTVSFKFTREMQPLEYYSVGYCIVHSNCNWTLGIRRDTEEEKLQMVSSGTESGDAKSTEHRVALRTVEPMSSEYLNTIFTHLGPHLEELYLRLADNGSSLSLTNLPALHILELGMCSKSTFNISSDFSLQSLESLTINAGNAGNTLGLKSCEAICKLLSTSISLKELHFNVAEGTIWSVGSKGMDAITKCISNNMALPLRSLEIECKCTFSNTAGKSLTLFIRNSTSLKYVSMCNIAVSAQGLQEVHEAIHNCSNLQEKKLKFLLHVQCSEDATKYKQLFNDYPDMLDSIDWEATSRIYKSDKQSDVIRISVITIDLHYNRISYLDLSRNNISDAVATAIAQALHHNSTLKKLDLFRNNISDAGATALAQAIHHNSTLKELTLSSNNISDAGATALAQALHHNSTLKDLNLNGNDGIGEEGTRQLVQALTVNTSVNIILLSKWCKEYASQCMEYNAVKTRIGFY